LSHRYKDLIVWQKARYLAGATYRATEAFPKSELYGLTSQMRRAAVSVASNIAEGQGRLTLGEFINFLGQSRGSLLELETQMTIANDLDYLSEDKFRELQSHTEEVNRLLNGLVCSLRRSKTG
jgi:four helix bundle protein